MAPCPRKLILISLLQDQDFSESKPGYATPPTNLSTQRHPLSLHRKIPTLPHSKKIPKHKIHPMKTNHRNPFSRPVAFAFVNFAFSASSALAADIIGTWLP